MLLHVAMLLAISGRNRATQNSSIVLYVLFLANDRIGRKKIRHFQYDKTFPTALTKLFLY